MRDDERSWWKISSCHSRQESSTSGRALGDAILSKGGAPEVQRAGQVDGVRVRVGVLHQDGDRHRQAAVVVPCDRCDEKGSNDTRRGVAERRTASKRAVPPAEASWRSSSCGALAFFRGDDLRKASPSRSAAVARSSGLGSKQFMRKRLACADMLSGTLGWILNIPTWKRGRVISRKRSHDKSEVLHRDQTMDHHPSCRLVETTAQNVLTLYMAA